MWKGPSPLCVFLVELLVTKSYQHQPQTGPNLSIKTSYSHTQSQIVRSRAMTWSSKTQSESILGILHLYPKKEAGLGWSKPKVCWIRSTISQKQAGRPMHLGKEVVVRKPKASGTWAHCYSFQQNKSVCGCRRRGGEGGMGICVCLFKLVLAYS